MNVTAALLVCVIGLSTSPASFVEISSTSGHSVKALATSDLGHMPRLHHIANANRTGEYQLAWHQAPELTDQDEQLKKQDESAQTEADAARLQNFTNSTLGDFRKFRPGIWRSPRPPTSGTVYLDEMPPVVVSSGHGDIGRYGRHPQDLRPPMIIERRFHPAVSRTNVAFQRVRPEFCLTFQGNSIAEYYLAGNYKFFRATVGKYVRSHGEAARGEPFTFRVWGDNQMLWESPPIVTASDYEECYVDVTDVQLLRLEMYYAGQNKVAPNDYEGLWITPYVSAIPPTDLQQDLFDPVKFARRGEFLRLEKQLLRALVADDFATLEEIVRETRLNPNFLHTEPKLYQIYSILAMCDAGMDYPWLTRIQFFERWQQTFPDSPTPEIGLLHTRLKYVQSIREQMDRPNAYVDQRAQIIVEQQTQAIHELLASLKDRQVSEGHLAYLEVSIAKLDNKPNQFVIDLVNQAIVEYPDYWPIYSEGILHLLERNRNSPEIASRLAAELRDQLGGNVGDELYARMAIACLRFGKRQPVQEVGFDPRQMGIGLWQLAVSHCENESLMNHVCQQACILEEKELAEALMFRLNGSIPRKDIWTDNLARIRFRRKYDLYWRGRHPYNMSSVGNAHEVSDKKQISFSPDGMQIFSSGEHLHTWNGSNLTTIVKTKPARDKFMNHHAISHDGKLLASHDANLRLSLYDVKTHAFIRHVGDEPIKASSMAFAPNDKELALIVNAHTIDFRDPATGASLRTLEVHEGKNSRALHLAYSVDGKLLATCGTDNLICLYDTETLKKVATLVGHTDEVQHVAFSPNGEVLASASRDGTIKIWDVANHYEWLTFFGHTQDFRPTIYADGHAEYSVSRAGTHAIAFAPKGRIVATVGGGGTVFLWNYRNGRKRAMFTDFSGVPGDLDIAPNGKTLGVCTRTGLYTFDMSWIKLEQELEPVDTFAEVAPSMIYFPLVIQNPTISMEAPFPWQIARVGQRAYSDRALDFAMLPDNLRHCVYSFLPVEGGLLKFEVVQPCNLAMAVSNGTRTEALRKQLLAAGWTATDEIRMSEGGNLTSWTWIVYTRKSTLGEKFEFNAAKYTTPILFGSSPMHTVPIAWPSNSLASEKRRIHTNDDKAKKEYELTFEEPIDLAETSIRAKVFAKNHRTRGTLQVSWPGQEWIDAATWDGDLRDSVLRFGGWHDFPLANLPEGSRTDRLSVRLEARKDRQAGPVEIAEVAWVKPKRLPASWKEFSEPLRLPAKETEFSPQHKLTIDLETYATSVAFSPSKNTIAAGLFNHDVHEWNATTGEHLRRYDGHARVYDLNYSPSGDRLLAGSHGGYLALYQSGTNKKFGMYPVHRMELAWAGLFSPDGKLALAAGRGISAYKLTAEDGMSGSKKAVDIPDQFGFIHAAAFARSGEHVYTGNANGEIRKWNLQTGKVDRTYEGKHTGAVKSILLSADGSQLITASPRDPLIRIWNEASGEEIAKLEGHESGVNGMTLTPDGKHLISGSCWRVLLGAYDGGSTEHAIRIWNLDQRKQTAQLDGHAALITDVAISHDGKMLVSAGLDKKLHVWDLTSLPLD